MRLREAQPGDLEAIVSMMSTLFPDSVVGDLRAHTRAILGGAPPSTLPLTILVAQERIESSNDIYM